MKALLTAVLAIALSTTFISCQSQKAYPVYFLTQEPSENAHESTSSRFIVYYRGKAFTRMPIMTLNHFEKFASYLQEDGSYGITLYAKKEYINHLYTATLEKRGLYLLPVVNGLAFELQYISRPITNGRLYIRNGLNGYDLKQISRTVEPLHPEIEEKRYKSDNPRPLPQKPKDAVQKKDFTGRTVGELF